MFQTILENYVRHSCNCYFGKSTKSERRIATIRESSFAIFPPPLPFKADPARAAESSAARRGNEGMPSAMGPQQGRGMPNLSRSRMGYI